MMYYGAQYYRPPFPNEEVWKRDILHMKELGFTFVPHNMFFTSIYYNGVFPLVLLLISIIGFFRILKYEHKYLILAILSSFVFTEYFHSEIGEAFALLFLVCIYKDYHTRNI